MKHCNNCGTVNIDTATQCEYCNIKGQFTFHSLPIRKEEQNDIVCCTNCGTRDKGAGKKCLQCNFPIAPAEQGSGQVSQSQAV